MDHLFKNPALNIILIPQNWDIPEKDFKIQCLQQLENVKKCYQGCLTCPGKDCIFQNNFNLEVATKSHFNNK